MKNIHSTSTPAKSRAKKKTSIIYAKMLFRLFRFFVPMIASKQMHYSSYRTIFLYFICLSSFFPTFFFLIKNKLNCFRLPIHRYKHFFASEERKIKSFHLNGIKNWIAIFITFQNRRYRHTSILILIFLWEVHAKKNRGPNKFII